MRLDPLHQTVKEVLEQVELHQFELDGARFPDLLFPRGVGPWDNHKFTKAECNRDAVEKLPELRKALLAYGDNVDAQAEALKTAYFVWQLRYLLGAIMFYSIKPFSIYWLVVFNKDQLARMLIKWAKCKKDARRTRIADIFTR